MTLGLIAATIALVSFSVSHTLLERDRIHAASAEILKSGPVESLLSDKIADTVTSTLPSGPAIAFQPAARVAARAALDDPAFRDAFAAGVLGIYDRVVDGKPGPVVFDATAVNASVRSALTRTEPQLAQAVPPAATFDVTIDPSAIPDLSMWTGLVRNLPIQAGLVAVLLVGASIAIDEHKRAAFSRVGWWLVVAGAFELLGAWALPFALQQIGGGAGAAGSVIGSTSSALVVPGVLMIAAGAATLLGTYAHRQSHRQTDAVSPLGQFTSTRTGATWKV
ncbi:MAG: hypothetical protein JWL73_1925 [Actinomycetia bacterium]|nr:hypothetical protein [Actinomycetes bacterium]